MRPIAIPAAPDPHPLTDSLSLAVMAEMSEHGYPTLTVAAVVARAGVADEEFRRRFGSLDDCVLDTYERLIAFVTRRLGAAFNSHSDWREGLRAAAYEIAELLQAYPHLARFGISEVLRMQDEMARVRREEIFVYFAEMIERGREAAPDPAGVPEGAAIMATGSILQLLTRRLQEGVEIDYHEAARESIYGVVRVYLGGEAAREELEMPWPRPVAAVV